MKTPWWLHFAKIGHSVGAGIAVAVSVAQFVPFPPLQIAAGVIATAAGVVTHYADQGIASVK